MKNIVILFLMSIITLACNSQKIYSDYDYSYSRSGGKDPIYENLLIKEDNVHYSLEGQGNKIKKSFKISSEDLKNINKSLKENNFRHILEDRKKLYNHVSVTINIRKGDQTGSKTDASLIMPKDQKKWEAILLTFQQIIDKNVKK